MTIWKALGTIATECGDERILPIAAAVIRARHQGGTGDVISHVEPGSPLDAVLRYVDPTGHVRSLHFIGDATSSSLRVEAAGDDVMFGTVADVTATLAVLGAARCYIGQAFSARPGRHDTGFASLDRFGFRVDRLLAENYLDEASLAVIVDWHSEGIFGDVALGDVLNLETEAAEALDAAILACEKNGHLGPLRDFLSTAFLMSEDTVPTLG